MARKSNPDVQFKKIRDGWEKLAEGDRLVIIREMANSFKDLVAIAILEAIDIMEHDREPKEYTMWGRELTTKEVIATAVGYRPGTLTLENALAILEEQGIECLVINSTPLVQVV